MEITLAILISIISLGTSIIGLFFGRKDKSNKDVGESQYKMGRLEEKIDEISKQIDKILIKLDKYEEEVDIKIEKAMNEHIKFYHKQKEK